MLTFFYQGCGLICLFLTLNAPSSFSSNEIPKPSQSSEMTTLSSNSVLEDNEVINKKAIVFLNDLINSLQGSKAKEKAALGAMRDYIQNHLKDEPVTNLLRSIDYAKVNLDVNPIDSAIGEFMHKTLSAMAKSLLNVNLQFRGTGRTTGHIADLSITNNSDANLELQPGLYYIPSNGRYQSYVIYIPKGIIIPPHSTLKIPINGYCADPHTPPVPLDGSFPEMSEWVPIAGDPTGGFGHGVAPPVFPEPMNPPRGSVPKPTTIKIFISDAPTTPSFNPNSIPDFISSSGFTPNDNTSGGLIPTWPGTEQEVGGTFNPSKDPTAFGPVITEGLLNIIAVVGDIQDRDTLTTPFSNDPKKEEEAIIQQTFWVFTAALTGDPYEEDDFSNNVYVQFKEATGKEVDQLPPAQKELIDEGVENFWLTFKATGIEAKVLKENTEDVPISSSEPEKSNVDVPISNPEPEKNTVDVPISNPESDDCCTSTSYCNFKPEHDFDMEIAEEWGTSAERSIIIDGARKSVERGIDPSNESVFNEFDISKNPTSSTAFWKAGIVGGFASAYAKTKFYKPDGSYEWVWGTQRMASHANGEMECTMAYTTSKNCKAYVAGTALIRINASSSAYDAMAGNQHDENAEDQLAFLRTTKYAAKAAIEWLVLRGRGKTKDSFRKHVQDDLKDQFKGQVSEAVEAEAQKLADQYLGGLLGRLGLSAEDLSMDNLELPNLETMLEQLLGFDIPSLADLEATIANGIEAGLNLFFVANTYATADGALVVHVGRDTASVRSHTSVLYNRKGTESTKDAITWVGDDCNEDMASDVLPNALTIKTTGFSDMVAEAVSRYGFGNGKADAYLESMNLQMLAGICIVKEGLATNFEIEVMGSLQWYSQTKEYQDLLKDALGPLEDEIHEELVKEVSKYQNSQKNGNMSDFSPEMLKNILEDKVKAWGKNHKFSWKGCVD